MSSYYPHSPSTSQKSRTTTSSHPCHPSTTTPSTPHLPSLTSLTPQGLPSDEYRTLRKRQDKHRLESHFAHNTPKGNLPNANLTTPHHHHPHQTAYQKANLPPSARLHISKLQNATRAALGPNFSFTHESYEVCRRNEESISQRAVEERRRGKSGNGRGGEPIPQRYIDEFNKMWAEDEDASDAEQARADRMVDARWRVHELPRGAGVVGGCARERREVRVDSAISVRERSEVSFEYEEERPELVSRFSTDSLVAEVKGRRGVFGRRR
ncbi:hypothetical protein T440DRAFT_540091 [Plenodomus tracheiphilus IPT5]|uniref:Uncharacterized protein n=1 Tax=Plenodomus tracheiphilus IPT5 TaxID=1408161 RepID=A0A6A7AYG4_9PLEO|nr:hypothetical protein T440DRAFT_540091 [Plenodomus tracheiphilus IPT5]